LADVHFQRQDHCSGQDNLNIHSKASLYEAFPAPKPDGWSSALNGTTPQAQLAIWREPNSASYHPSASIAGFRQTNLVEETRLGARRNANHTKANWHFTTPNARIKLKHLYLQSD
jgi:hypothetical protein